MKNRMLYIVYGMSCFAFLLLTFYFAGLACAETAMLHSFNKGEVTPKIAARADVKMYYSGNRVMENFYCQVYGGASKRPGTYFISEAADSDNTARVIPFSQSTERNYVLEFGDKTVQFYLGD